MGYIKAVIGTIDQLVESRYVSVVVGSPAPAPVTGYSMSPKLFTLYNLDWYEEHREIPGAFTPK